jgi:DNA-binding CsgD family transcriptional regulator
MDGPCDAPDLELLTAAAAKRSDRLRGGLLAWAEVLDALGWCVAIRLSAEAPYLNKRAQAWLSAAETTPCAWQDLVARWDGLSAADYLLCTDEIRVWAGERPRPMVAPADLTKREAEVLEWLRAGKTGPEIAIILGCASRTVESHVARLYRKLGVHNRAQLLFQSPTSE